MLQTLVIKCPIVTLNEYINVERSNRFGAASVKKKETNRVAQECLVQKIQPVPKINEITFTYYMKDKRLDPDNVEFFQKFFWDGLTTAKIIQRDTYDFTPKQRTHIHEIDKENPRIEICFSG